MNNGILLLKTLLLSTSGRNIRRYSKDKKKRKRVVMSAVGVVCLFAMLMAYSVAMCVGYGKFGMISAVPETCALTISLLAFVFTLFKTNGYLFNFKEYDMLMSLPFEASTVAGCKFLYMYVKSLLWYVSISVAMLVGYGIYAHPPVVVYPLWLALSLLLPLIPMLAASFLGFLIARISAGFRKTNMVQTVLTLVFVLFCFSIRFILEDLFRNDKVQATLMAASRVTGDAAKLYLPAGWFAGAVTKLRVSDMLLLAGVSVALFAVVFALVGRSYRQINSALKSHAAARRFRMSAQRQRGVVTAIAAGEATITATAFNGKKATARLEVKGVNVSLPESNENVDSNTTQYSPNMTNAEKLEYVIYRAQTQLGKPYIYGSGYTKDDNPPGFDCSGLVYWSFLRIGIKLKDSAYKQGYDSNLPKISITELKRGDVVCFDTVSDDDLSDHTGIYLGGGKFIHASSSGSTVIISTLASGYYNRTFSWGRRVLN